jgi:hypothetical protein
MEEITWNNRIRLSEPWSQGTMAENNRPLKGSGIAARYVVSGNIKTVIVLQRTIWRQRG